MVNFLVDYAGLAAAVAVLLALLLVSRIHRRHRQRIFEPPVGAYRTYPTYR